MHNRQAFDISGSLGIHPFVRQKHAETSAAIACMIVIANSKQEIERHQLLTVIKPAAHECTCRAYPDKLDRQSFLVCGQHLRHFRHS